MHTTIRCPLLLGLTLFTSSTVACAPTRASKAPRASAEAKTEDPPPDRPPPDDCEPATPAPFRFVDPDPPAEGPPKAFRFEVREQKLEIGGKHFVELKSNVPLEGARGTVGIRLRRPDGTELWMTPTIIGKNEGTAYSYAGPFAPTSRYHALLNFSAKQQGESVLDQLGTYELSFHDPSGEFAAPSVTFDVERGEVPSTVVAPPRCREGG